MAFFFVAVDIVATDGSCFCCFLTAKFGAIEEPTHYSVENGIH